jgi:hypothetical protein
MKVQNLINWINKSINISTTAKKTKASIALIWEMNDGSFLIEFYGSKNKPQHSFEKVSREEGLGKIKELNFTPSQTLYKALFPKAAQSNANLTNAKNCYFNNN